MYNVYVLVQSFYVLCMLVMYSRLYVYLKRNRWICVLNWYNGRMTRLPLRFSFICAITDHCHRLPSYIILYCCILQKRLTFYVKLAVFGVGNKLIFYFNLLCFALLDLTMFSKQPSRHVSCTPLANNSIFAGYVFFPDNINLYLLLVRIPFFAVLLTYKILPICTRFH